MAMPKFRTVEGFYSSAEPGIPVIRSLRRVAGSPTSVVLEWNAPSQGNSPIKSYKIVPYRNQTRQEAKIITVSGSSTSATLTGLDAGNLYTFHLTATNESDLISDTAISTPIKPATAPEYPPTITQIIPLNNSVRINLNPHVANGGSPITSFKIFIVSGGTTTETTNVTLETPVYAGLPAGTFLSPNAAIVSGLTNGVEYGFRAKSTNEIGDSVMSQETKATVGPVAISPLPPFTFSTSPSGNSITISWAHRTHPVGASPIS
jgi:titin